MVSEPSAEFDGICSWMGNQKDFITGSPLWAHELRSRISAVERVLSSSELDSLNHTLSTMHHARNMTP